MALFGGSMNDLDFDDFSNGVTSLRESIRDYKFHQLGLSEDIKVDEIYEDEYDLAKKYHFDDGVSGKLSSLKE